MDATKPIGEWNHVKIVYDGKHVEHWMNGVKYWNSNSAAKTLKLA